MAFTGDLEHLPIVDLIQLLNSTRKSGVLTVSGRKGVSQLVFKEGYIVSASHLNNSVRIGQVLVEKGFVTPTQIEQGLAKQQADGGQRRPLAITLIEMEVLKEADAYKALQHLIEITVVEILTWKTGKFTLDHLKDVIDCDFKYYPEKMNHEINVNTQGILMDALRIFDEKMRDGLIEEERDEPAIESAPGDELISEDDLGLSETDYASTRLPQAFSGVAPFDPIALQRKKLAAAAPDLAVSDREKLTSALAKYTKEKPPEGKCSGVALHLADKLLLHSIDTVLTDTVGTQLVSSQDGIEKLFDGASGVKVYWLIADAPVGRVQSVADSGARVIMLVPAGDVTSALNGYIDGATAIIPLSARGEKDFADNLIKLLEILPEYLKNHR